MGIGKYAHPKYYAKRAVNWEHHERRAKQQSAGCLGTAIGVLLVLTVVFLVVMWPISFFGHMLGLTPNLPQLLKHNHVWEHKHYPLVGLRYVAVVAIMIAAVLGLAALFARRPSNS